MLTEDGIGVKKKVWKPPPSWSRLRRKTLAIVYHWGASKNPAMTTQQGMYEYLERNKKTKAYHAIVHDEIWQCLHWDMSAGALGLNNLEDYPESTRRLFKNQWPDLMTINILMMEDDTDGRYGILAVNNGMMLGSYLCQRYQLTPTEDVLRHSDVTGKGTRPETHPLYKPDELPCPRFYVENPQSWEIFRLRMHEVLCMDGDGRWDAGNR